MLTKENLFSFVSLKRHFRGDYSCATAHDLHVIPYSPLLKEAP